MKINRTTIFIIVLVVITVAILMYVNKSKTTSKSSNTSNTSSSPVVTHTVINTGGSNSTPVSNPAVFPLQRGSSGNEVKQLQTYLNTLGAGITVDGQFGNATFNALQSLLNITTVSQDDFNEDVLGQSANTSGVPNNSVTSSGDTDSNVITTSSLPCNLLDPTTWGTCLL